MTDDCFKAVPIDWTKIPILGELEFYVGTTLGYYRPGETPRMLLKGKPKFTLSMDAYVLHKKASADGLIQLYESNGFETRVILQDPFGHVGPTVACPIGFPFNLPFPSPQLARFKRWICRVHVDIAHQGDSFFSVPHIEPDPTFHALTHVWDTYIKKHVVRGKEAVAALNFLGIK